MLKLSTLLLLSFFTVPIISAQTSNNSSDKKSGTFKDCRSSAKNENYYGCHFNKTINFEGHQFHQFANFNHIVFDGYADFEESDIYNGISFKGALFNGDFSIYRMEDFSADFDSAVFKGEARFERLGFKNTVNFSNCTFDGKVSFRDVGLVNANFSHLTLNEKTDFSFNNTSAKKLDFSFNPKIFNEIRLVDGFDDKPYAADTSKKSACLINLYHSDISKFYLNYYGFKLYFPDYLDTVTNDSVKITSYERQVIYENLLTNFKNHDQMDSYKLLDIEYQCYRYDLQGQKFFKYLDRYWWNFGYDKNYIFKWTLGLLLLFTLVNFFLLEYLNNNIYTLDGISNSHGPILMPNSLTSSWSTFVAIYNRLWFSFVYTVAIFFMITINLKDFKFRNKLGTFYLVSIYVIGIICLAYMANYVLHK